MAVDRAYRYLVLGLVRAARRDPCAKASLKLWLKRQRCSGSTSASVPPENLEGPFVAISAELAATKERLLRLEEMQVKRAQEWGGTLEAADRAGCSEQTVRNRCEEQWKLPPGQRAFALERNGRNWRIEIMSFVESERGAKAAKKVRAKHARAKRSVAMQPYPQRSPKVANAIEGRIENADLTPVG